MLLSMLLKLNTSACKFESVVCVCVCVYSFLLPLKIAFLKCEKGSILLTASFLSRHITDLSH